MFDLEIKRGVRRRGEPMNAQPKTKTINVTKVHIRAAGYCQTGDFCPVSRAVHEAFGKRYWITRDFITTIHKKNDTEICGRRQIAALPRRAQIAISKWDTGRGMKPFSFRIRLAEKTA